MPQTIPPTGPRDAEIVLLGEAPGREENRRGVPFVGMSGRLLFDSLLPRTGIHRADCRILNTYWLQPPRNDLDALPPKRREQFWQQTVDDIVAYPRRLLIPLGKWATYLLTGYSAIMGVRGSVLHQATSPLGPQWPCPIIPTLHPSDLLHTPSHVPLVLHDMDRIRQVLRGTWTEGPERTAHHYHALLASEGSPQSAHAALLQGLQSLRSASLLSLDIETYERTITCIGLASSATEAWVVPLTGELPPSQTAELLHEVDTLLRSGTSVVGQNVNYDIQYLAACYGIGVANLWMDTMVAHAIVSPELPHDLATQVSLYTHHPYYKDMRKESESPEPNAVRDEYNGLDCMLTYETARGLEQQLHHSGLYPIFSDIDMPASRTLAALEYRGVPVDQDKREEAIAASRGHQEELLAGMQGINPNSSQQVVHLIRSNLPPSLARLCPNAQKDTLKRLARRLAKTQKHAWLSQVIGNILAYKGHTKEVGTYLEAQVSSDGRIRSSFYTHTTVTGRLSARKEPMGGGQNPFGGGLQMQNVPKSQRVWFVPEPNRVFWQADSSQAEARVTAWLSQDEGYIQAFLNGRDVHSEHAKGLFFLSCPVDASEGGCYPSCPYIKTAQCPARQQIPGSEYTYRDAGKRGTHAIDYRIGAPSLCRYMNTYFPQLGMTEDRTQRFIDEFFELRPGVHVLWEWIDEQMASTGTLKTPYGRRRKFWAHNAPFESLREKALKDATAFIPQSTAADLVKIAMFEVDDDLRARDDADVLIQVHDSVCGTCTPEALPEVEQIVCTRMQQDVPNLAWHGTRLSIPADFSSGLNWKECG